MALSLDIHPKIDPACDFGCFLEERMRIADHRERSQSSDRRRRRRSKEIDHARRDCQIAEVYLLQQNDCTLRPRTQFADFNCDLSRSPSRLRSAWPAREVRQGRREHVETLNLARVNFALYIATFDELEPSYAKKINFNSHHHGKINDVRTGHFT